MWTLKAAILILNYLPSADKSVITFPATRLKRWRKFVLARKGGRMAIMIYYGQDEETSSVSAGLCQSAPQKTIEHHLPDTESRISHRFGHDRKIRKATVG